MTLERVHEIEFFRGAARDDVAVFTSIAGEHARAMVVARTAASGCHQQLLDEALATARRAELRYRLAGLPFAAGALLVHATDATAHRQLMARVGAGLHEQGFTFVPDAGLGAGDLALLRAAPARPVRSATSRAGRRSGSSSRSSGWSPTGWASPCRRPR